MNTIIPYTNGVYYDVRPVVGIKQEDVLPINDELGWNPSAALLKEMFDEGDMAIVQGIGYPNSVGLFTLSKRRWPYSGITSSPQGHPRTSTYFLRPSR